MNFGLHKIVDSVPTVPVRVALALPRHWKHYPAEDFFAAFRNILSGLLVLATIDTMEDGSKYLHISCSFQDRLPSWEDLRTVKDLFICEDREAFQVLPKTADYVNLHPYCLHLWAEE